MRVRSWSDPRSARRTPRPSTAGAAALALGLGLGLGAGLAAPVAAAPVAVAPASVSTAGDRSILDQVTTASYVVQLRPGLVANLTRTVADLAAAYGGEVGFVYRTALTGFSVRLPALAASALRANPLVASVRPDVTVQATDTQTGATWGLDRSDQRSLPLDGSYSYPGLAGQGAHVYVIDTGLRASHSEFAGRVGTSRNFVAPFLIGSPDPAAWDDCNGHGTHVASTAAGTVWGVAKKAQVHGVRVLNCQGSGTSSAIIAGIDWVAANHAPNSVANLSLGTTGGRAPDIDAAVRGLVAAGVATAVAAGNSNTDACTSSPSAEPTVLTVGATTRTDARASFSNLGSCLDLFAPGEMITAADYTSASGGRALSGTSMASPHVAGALALVRAANPGLGAVAAQDAVVGATTAGSVGSAGAGSPNRLLFVGGAGPAPADAAPTAAFTASCSGLVCSFDAGGSTDDRGIASYSWSFGDGGSATGVTTSRTYATGGSYGVTLRVTDTNGQSSTATRTVTPSAGGTTAPCTNCTRYTGSLSAGGQAYHPGTAGFSWGGGVVRGYLRGPGTANFDLVLERRSCLLLCSWSTVASGTSASASEDVAYAASSGTYRWRVRAVAGSGAYTFWGEPR